MQRFKSDSSSCALRGLPSTSAAVLETDTHSVVRAGAVPSVASAAASSARHCSGKVLSHGYVKAQDRTLKDTHVSRSKVKCGINYVGVLTERLL